ncbi:MAG: hypothetical protein AAFX78_03665 [Cyanobacteria bacterium J06638_20]
MNFKNEAELQEAIAAWLNQRGHQSQREVKTGGGRVDILTSQHLIEVKPKLSRSAQFQALGQLQTYDKRFPRHQKVIAGLTPSSASSAYTTATRIREDGVEVWFMDSMPEFVRFVKGQGQPAKLRHNIPMTWWSAPYLFGKEIEGTFVVPILSVSTLFFFAWLWTSGLTTFWTVVSLLFVFGVLWLIYDSVMNWIASRNTRR